MTVEPSDFQRARLDAGHQRPSPGDTGATASSPSHGQAPPRAGDYDRGTGQVTGGAATGMYPGAPTPISPEEALFGAAGNRYNFGPFQADTHGMENKDDSKPEACDPVETQSTQQLDDSAAELRSRGLVPPKAAEADISFLGRGAPGSWDKGQS